MKILVAFLGLALVTSVLQAETPAAPAPADPKATTTATPASTPAVKPDATVDAKAKAVDPKKKKEEVMGKIAGITIARANGTFLGFEVVNTKFKLSFYDKKKKPMAADVTRATARWPNRRSALPTDYRTVLNGSGTALMGAKPVLPPFPISVHLVLLQGDGDDSKVVEQYDVTYTGS